MSEEEKKKILGQIYRQQVLLKINIKDCDKDTLINIIAEVCTIYVQEKVFSDISSANCIQQCVNNIQTNIQEIDNFLTQ